MPDVTVTVTDVAGNRTARTVTVALGGDALILYADQAPYNMSHTATAAVNSNGLRQALADINTAGGGIIVLPGGVLQVGQPAGSNTYCFAFVNNLTIVGAGRNASILQFAGTDAASLAIFSTAPATSVTNVRLAHFAIDGNKAARAADEHKCGIRAGGGGVLSSLTLDDVIISHCPGDAVQLIQSARVRIHDAEFRDNGRCGLSLTPPAGFTATDIVVSRSYLEGAANAIDVEPGNSSGAVDTFVVEDTTLGLIGVGGFPVSFGLGYYNGGTGQATNVRFSRCEILGGSFNIQGVNDFKLSESRIVNTGSHAAVGIHGGNENVVIEDVTIDHQVGVATNYNAAITVYQDTPTTTAFQPGDVALIGNTIVLHDPTQHGIFARAAKHTTIRDNTISWDPATAAGSTAAGILVDGAVGQNAQLNAETVRISDNLIRNPRGKGIWVRHVAFDKTITHTLQIDRNTILDDQASHTLTVAVQVDAGATGPSCVVRNNTDNVAVSV